MDGKPYITWPVVDQYGQSGGQTDESLMARPHGPYGSLQSTSYRPNRSVTGPNQIQSPLIDRSGASLIHQSPRSFTQPFLPHNSFQYRSDWYPTQQQPRSQSPQTHAAMLDHVIRKPFVADAKRVRRRNEIRYSKPSTGMVTQPVSNPSSASRDGSAQAAIEASLQKKRQVQSSLLSIVTKCPRERSMFEQATDIVMTAQKTVNNKAPSDAGGTSVRGYPLKAPKPTEQEWTTYRIDNRGTRLPKTEAPPRGTYKISEGIGKTDYSDPREFFAPTIREQKHVWNALRATRAALYELTNIQLKPNDMKTLYMGYNAAWNEIKRKFTGWIFENFSPDRSVSHHVTVPVQRLSDEIREYAAEGVQVVVNRPHNPKNIQYFVKGELVVNVSDLLPRLERWYGLIEDYRFSPTWTYERLRNSHGVLIQNPECCACMHCRKDQILCYGFRERADRKCTPCVIAGLLCSNEEDPVENKLIRG